MSVLHKASVIYADFENIIANTDHFVCSKLYENLKDSNDISEHPIHGFFDVVKEAGIDCLPLFTLQKKTHNPLRELADLSKVKPEDNISKEQQADIICDNLYDSILSFDYADYSLDMFTFTNTALAIKILLKDSQLNDVYIYVKNMSVPIHKAIYNHFDNSSKVHIITGDRRPFFNEYKCDLYMFNDIMDIELLPPVVGSYDKDAVKTDLLFLDTIPNKKLWDEYFADAPNVHVSIADKYRAEISILKRTI